MCGHKDRQHTEKIRNGQISIINNTMTLAFARVVTMSVSIIQTMILSRTLTKTNYGTYSQAILIIGFVAPFFSLGLENAVNFFYNRSAEIRLREKFINTIFAISVFSGILCGAIILVLQGQIAGYLNNAAIEGLTFWIAFRPCFQNLIALYQPLFISSGYAETIAKQNFVISIVQVGIVGGISCFSDNVVLILGALLLLDMLQLFCFAVIYRKKKFPITVFKADHSLVREILKYAVPMLLAASLSTISLNVDKLMISGLMSIEDYALYSNVSKELPFAFVVSSFTAVVTPLIIRYISEGQYKKFKNLWSAYLEVGYMVTWPLCVGAIVLGPEMIEVLYSENYLCADGIMIFRIYTVASMVRFTYLGLIPTALGRTNIVLKYSGIICLLNICLNYPMYLLIGMPGPAVATVASLVIGAVLYFRASVKLVNVLFWEVLVPKKLVILLGEMFFCGIVVRMMVSAVEEIYSNVFVNLSWGFIMFILLIYGINFKKLKNILIFLKKED